MILQAKLAAIIRNIKDRLAVETDTSTALWNSRLYLVE